MIRDGFLAKCRCGWGDVRVAQRGNTPVEVRVLAGVRAAAVEHANATGHEVAVGALRDGRPAPEHLDLIGRYCSACRRPMDSAGQRCESCTFAFGVEVPA